MRYLEITQYYRISDNINKIINIDDFFKELRITKFEKKYSKYTSNSRCVRACEPRL